MATSEGISPVWIRAAQRTTPPGTEHVPRKFHIRNFFENSDSRQETSVGSPRSVNDVSTQCALLPDVGDELADVDESGRRTTAGDDVVQASTNTETTAQRSVPVHAIIIISI
jgi:hypothetical protein